MSIENPRDSFGSRTSSVRRSELDGPSIRESLLLLVDLQAGLLPAIEDAAEVLAAADRALRAARLLGIPIRLTEHCPEAIGGTAPMLAAAATADEILAKRRFNATAEPDALSALRAVGRPQIAIAGTEAHVCVAQTALGLRRAGFSVFVLEDACGSRRRADRQTGLARLTAAGCVPLTVEALLFEWLGDADHPRFRDVLAIIKEA